MSGRYISTDDAYVQGARTDISANVSGRVIEILVVDNQEVVKDQVLYKLDDRDFVNARNDAEAKLASAKLQIISLKAQYRQQSAQVQSAKATLTYWKREFKRQEILAELGISSQNQLDQTKQSLRVAQKTLDAMNQDLSSILASLADNPEIEVENHPIVMQAQAIFDQAELNLSYTVIKAPLDGIVSRVEQLQVGDYVNASSPVFGLVASRNMWAEGNFKETELTNIQPGQTATITIDTYPDRIFHGKVVSISPCTGSVLSLLPPENATGNWVKVVQRLPVRVSIDDPDPAKPLRMGLSVVIEVDTHSNRGKNATRK
jgi:membrane fusion protein (multidrug efflux system)